MLNPKGMEPSASCAPDFNVSVDVLPLGFITQNMFGFLTFLLLLMVSYERDGSTYEGMKMD